VRICGCCVWIRARISVRVRIRVRDGVRVSNRVRRRVKLVNYSLITALPIATSADPLFTRGQSRPFHDESGTSVSILISSTTVLQLDIFVKHSALPTRPQLSTGQQSSFSLLKFDHTPKKKKKKKDYLNHLEVLPTTGRVASHIIYGPFYPPPPSPVKYSVTPVGTCEVMGLVKYYRDTNRTAYCIDCVCAILRQKYLWLVHCLPHCLDRDI